jgi:hypothetical protein
MAEMMTIRPPAAIAKNRYLTVKTFCTKTLIEKAEKAAQSAKVPYNVVPFRE